MLKLLAPTTLESVNDGESVILEMDAVTFRGIAAAVEVAFDDPGSTPDEYKDVANDLWHFFRAGRA